jgi:hypothetical protein
MRKLGGAHVPLLGLKHPSVTNDPGPLSLVESPPFCLQLLPNTVSHNSFPSGQFEFKKLLPELSELCGA